MTICRLCGLQKQLIDAHIIPRQLYKPIREASSGSNPGEQTPRVYAVGTQEKSKQVQSGIYDKSILCRECDGNLLGPLDKYGQTLLLSSPDPAQYISDSTGKRAAYKIDTFDYKQLKLFFISILWRAAITTNQFFSQVNLGPWEDKLKHMVLTQDPGDENDFSTILFKYEGDLSEIMQNPTKQRQDGVNYYRFRLPNYGFLIKVDQRNFPFKLVPSLLSPSQPLLIRIMEYKDSKEYERLLEIRDEIPN